MQIFELFGAIKIDDKAATTALDNVDKKGSSVSKGLGLSFGSIASAALKVGAVIGVGLGLKDMIANASAAEDRLAQMDAVLKSTGGTAGMTKDELLKLATAQGQLTTYSKGANIESENLLLTFTGIGKDVFPQALTAVNDMSTALGQDTKSSCIQLGKALNDPIGGITALKRVGVAFTDDQKEQIKTLVKNGDTMGAQKIILAELAKEFGGSAAAAGATFSGQLTIMQNNLKGIGTQIGSAVMPYLTQFFTWINSHMPQIKQFVSDAMKVIGDNLKLVADFVTKNIIPAFDAFWKWIQPNIPLIKQIVSDAFNVIKGVFKLVGDYIVNFVIPTYKAMADWFFKNFPAIKDAVMKAYEYIKPSFDNLVAVVKKDLIPIIQDLWTKVQAAMPGIQKIFQVVFPLVVAAIKLAIDIIATFIGVVKGIYDFISPGLNDVINLFNTVANAIKAAFDWLTKWNNTPAKNKDGTITQSASTFKTGNSAGTDNWRGGLTAINELGGEIVDLPQGTRIIPHDVSMEMARNQSNSKNRGDFYFTIQTFNNNRKEDYQELMEEMKIYMDHYNLATGGTT